MRLTRLLMSIGLTSVLVATGAAPAAAQGVTGRVVDSATAAPIYGAMVELQDSAGRVLREVLTTASGGFALAPPVAGVYRYRVAAIGYRPRPAERLVVTAGTDVGTIALPRLVVTLPDIVARADRNSCSESPASDPILARLLASADNALEMMEAAVYTGRLAFRVELVHSTAKTYGNHTVTQSDTSYQPMVVVADPEPRPRLAAAVRLCAASYRTAARSTTAPMPPCSSPTGSSPSTAIRWPSGTTRPAKRSTSISNRHTRGTPTSPAISSSIPSRWHSGR